MEVPYWSALAGCQSNHREILERFVNRAPAAWRQPPQLGESFTSISEAAERLRLFALVTGFFIVNRGGGNRRSPGAVFKCIHHGVETRNERGLEDRVIYNENGVIITRRKRNNTTVRQTRCC